MLRSVHARVALVVLALAFLSAPVRADVIKLRDGRMIEGRIIKEDDKEVKVLMTRGAIALARADILEIVRQKSTVEELDERLAALVPTQPALYLETGKWCIETLKVDDVGLRAIQVAMALDPNLYVTGQVYLGDYYKNKKDRAAANRAYLRALCADPAHAALGSRMDDVKDAIREAVQRADQNLVAGIEALQAGALDKAADALKLGQESSSRANCEELLGTSLAAVISACEARTGCRVCKGTREVDCPECKGKAALECKTCRGNGWRRRTIGKRVDWVLCGACAGWGNILCPVCKPTHVQAKEQPLLPGAVRDESGALLVPVVDPNAAPPPRVSGTVQGGGKVPCRFCKSTDVSRLPLPAKERASRCLEYLQRRSRGELTLIEQCDTALYLVGSAPEVEGAKDLLATPVWWGGKWVTVAERQAADPSFKARTADATEGFEAVRKGATALVPEGGALDAFRGVVEALLAAGAPPADARPVYCTDFGLKPPADAHGSAGPFAEIDARANRLLPCLFQVAPEYSLVRVNLDSPTGPGLALTGKVDLAGLAATPGTRVRLYYTVLDHRQVILPAGTRDVATTHLVVKLLLADFLDADGKVLASTR